MSEAVDDVSALRLQQSKFVLLIAQFIQWVYSQPGLALTFGEAYRTPEQAAWDAQHGTGISNSLHTQRLAVDFNLFVNGVYQSGGDAYAPLGAHWEALGGSWGGAFASRDYNHFSLEYGGVREVGH
jgi:D-alanyl-D-alanine carboxypeptidase